MIRMVNASGNPLQLLTQILSKRTLFEAGHQTKRVGRIEPICRL